MDYFCPFCQKRPKHENIAVGLDNSVLEKALKQIPIEQRDTIIEQYDKRVNDLMEYTKETTLTVGFPKPEGTSYRIDIGLQQVLEAITFGIDYLARRRAANVQNTINDSDFAGIKELYQALGMYADFPVYQLHNIMAIFAPDSLGNQIFRMAPGPYRKLCGKCHQPLFEFAGEGREIVIGLLGSERVGKSTCIVSTIASFLQDATDSTGLVFDTPSDADKRWVDTIKDPLLKHYKNGWAVQKTQTNVEGTAFCVSLKARIPNGEQVILTFVDMPGEYMHSGTGIAEQWYKQYLGLYANVDAFWFCIDGSQLNQTTTRHSGYNTKNARDQSHIVDPGVLSTNLKAIKDAITQYNLNHRMPPAAIIYTKSDEAIFHEDESDELWWSQTPASIYKKPEHRDLATEAGIHTDKGIYHNGGGSCYLLEETFADTSKEIRSELGQIGNSVSYHGHSLARNILTVLEQTFMEHAYFSTSAYSRLALPAPQIVYCVGAQYYAKFEERQAWQKYSETKYFTCAEQLDEGYGFLDSIYKDGTLVALEQPVLVLVNGTYSSKRAFDAAEDLQWVVTECDKGAPRPFRANLPLLWTLAMLGKLPVRAEIEMKPRNTLLNLLKNAKPYMDFRFLKVSRDERKDLENTVRQNLCSSTFTEHEELF